MSVSEAQKTSRRDLKVAFGAALAAQIEKNAPARQETGVWFLGQEDPLEKTMQLTPAFLPGESHGQRSLAGYRIGPGWTTIASGKEGLWASPVRRRLAHLFLTRGTAAAKRAWGCAEEEETPQQRRPLRSSLVRDAPRASASADPVRPFTAHNATRDFRLFIQLCLKPGTYSMSRKRVS